MGRDLLFTLKRTEPLGIMSRSDLAWGSPRQHTSEKETPVD